MKAWKWNVYELHKPDKNKLSLCITVIATLLLLHSAHGNTEVIGVQLDNILSTLDRIEKRLDKIEINVDTVKTDVAEARREIACVQTDVKHLLPLSTTMDKTEENVNYIRGKIDGRDWLTSLAVPAIIAIVVVFLGHKLQDRKNDSK